MSNIDLNEELTDNDFMTLEYEDGTEEKCLILGIFAMGDTDYIALAPEDEDSSDIYLYRYVEDGESFELIEIEDDDEFDKVSEEFDSIIAEIEE